MQRVISLLFVLFGIVVHSSFGQNISDVWIDSVITNVKNPSVRIDYLLDRSSKLLKTNYEAALFPAIEAVKLSEVIQDSVRLGKSYNALGVSLDYASRYELAEHYFFKSYEITHKFSGPSATSEVLNNLGVATYYQGKYNESLSYYLKSLEVKEKFLKDRSAESRLKFLATYNNLGNVWDQIGSWTKSKAYYESALGIASELELSDQESLIMGNIVTLLINQDSIDLADPIAKRAYHIADSLQEQNLIASSLLNIGIIEYEKENYNEAEAYFEKAKNHYVSLNDSCGLSKVNYNLSLIFLNKNQFVKAKELADQVVDFEKNHNVGGYLLKSKLLYARVYEKQQPRKAIEFLQDYIELKDSQDAVLIAEKINDQEVIFKTEQKNAEIELLQAEKDLIIAEKENSDLRISRKNVYLILLTACFVLIVIVGVMFFLFLNSKKKNAEERAKKLFIYHQREIDRLRNAVINTNEIKPLTPDMVNVLHQELNNYLKNPLSERELEVLYLVAEGKMNKEIAEKLSISINTVKTHVVNICEKLDVQNRTAAAVKANNLNILK